MGNIGETIAPGIVIPESEPVFVPESLPPAPSEPVKTPVKEPVPA